jgi:V-type H+-transporting ATPase subunit d
VCVSAVSSRPPCLCVRACACLYVVCASSVLTELTKMGNAWDGHGGMTTFNVRDGYEEAWIRGYRSGFITHQEYQQLMDYKPSSDKDGNKLNDIKLNLQETDYGPFLADYTGHLDSQVLKRKMQEKVAAEFYYLRCIASPPLAKFLDYIACKYMIENVITILSSQGGDMETLLEDRCHPLGRFDDSVLRSLMNCENSAEGIEEVYSLVLVDTPIGPYFAKLVEALGGGDLKTLLRETSTNIVEELLHRFYLEDFHRYCLSLGGETAVVMGDILEQCADHRSIQIVYNSVVGGSSVLSQPRHHADRAMLFPAFGKLYPMLLEQKHEPSRRIGFYPIQTLAELKHSLSHFPDFKRLANSDVMEGRPDERSNLATLLFEQEVCKAELAFEGQFHYGMFYGYFRLKEQEIKNVEYIANMTQLGAPEEMKAGVIPIFYEEQPWRTGIFDEF